jgi:hypothetical protein
MQKEEEMFLEALWGFYRGGKPDSATEFCLSSGQAWRAASILGGSLYSTFLLSTKRGVGGIVCWGEGYDARIYGYVLGSELETGNPNRITWKNACCELARHV